MKRNRKTRSLIARFIVCFALLGFVAVISGCNADAGMRLGVDIPENEPVVKLASVKENPSEYNGKTIVMKGIVSGQCASLCEFFFTDGVHKATIYPQGFKFPKLEQGKPVTIYTQIISGEGSVVFSALGLKMQ